MDNEIKCIIDFLNNRIFYLKEDIICLTRKLDNEKNKDNTGYIINEIRKKLDLIDYLETYTIEDDHLYEWYKNFYNCDE